MKTLKQMLNENGYKEHSEINPLILQSKVLKCVREWLQQKRQQLIDIHIHPFGTEVLYELLEEL